MNELPPGAASLSGTAGGSAGQGTAGGSAGPGIAGERDETLVNRGLSIQSRVSNALALGLMSFLGLGMLTWYYAHAMLHDSAARESAHAQSARRAQGDLALPALGRIDAPGAAPLAPAEGAAAPTRGPESAQPDTGTVAPPLPLPMRLPMPLAETQPVAGTLAAPGAAAPRTAAQTAQERELSGAVFAAQTPMGTALSSGGYPAPGDTTGADYPRPDELRGAGDSRAAAGTPAGSELGALMRPTVTPAVRAGVLPGQRLLLPKGAFIDCTLETAIDSTLPGLTSCVTATDTFGADGTVVLLERGTKLVGEARGQVQQGAARVFVLWTEARTPTGVIVPLDSPGADELGRAGLAGDVNRHFWQRFGAAMLVSMIDGAVQAAAQSTNKANGAVIYSPSGSQSVITEVLKSTVGIPPTILKQQGDRLQVLVARDLDFTTVYALQTARGP